MLSSGRHVGLNNEHWRAMITEGDDVKRSAGIIEFRLRIRDAEALAKDAAIVLYQDNLGPPAGTPYLAGYLVRDVLGGQTDWPPGDVADLDAFLHTDRARAWLQTEFDELDALIKSSEVWQSPFWTED